MADDDDDFTFGDIGEDFADDDGWGAREDEAGGTGEPVEDSDLDPIAQGAVPAAPLDSVEPVGEEKPPAAAVDEPAAENVRRSPSRMVLYGLLVVVLSAAGFYYFTTSPSPPAAGQRPAPAKQTLVMPERPEPSTATATPATEPVSVDRMPVVEAKIPKGTLREVLPTEPPPAPLVVEAKPAAPAVPAVAVKSPPPAAAVVKKTAAKKPVAAGKYSIQAGAFVDHVNRDETLAKISQLGFEGKVIPVKKVMPMTRLLIGVYAADMAKQKAKELEKTIPTVFYLRRGDQLAVYAGSFYEIDKARVFADGLYKNGVKVEEEKTEVELTLSRLRFGSFPDQATAKQAAKRARAVGLEADVVRNP